MVNFVRRADVDAWLLKCNPRRWGLMAFVRDGHHTIENWTISQSDRRLEAGQPVLFWVTGPAGHTPTPGLWGAGVITGRDYVDPDLERNYWLDEPTAPDTKRWIPVDIELFAAPIPRTALADDPRLRDLQILKAPKFGSLQPVTAAQLAVVERYLDPSDTAAFGPSAQARATVMDAYRQAGWRVERAATAGWDLACRHGMQELRIVARRVDRIELGRAEIAAANDPRWRLIVVNGSRIDTYDGDEVLDRAEPITYVISP